MRTGIIIFIVLTMVSFSSTNSTGKSSSILDGIDEKIEKTPDDPQLYQAKSVLLMELGRYNEGYEAARQAMAAHIRANDNVAWFGLERIDLGNYFVTIGFNMTATERNPPLTGITRPLTFRLYNKNAVPVAGIIDYEAGMINGKAASVAFRERDGKTILNFDSIEKASAYKDIRAIGVKLINTMYLMPKPGPQGLRPEEGKIPVILKEDFL
jgi:hypothetical protein